MMRSKSLTIIVSILLTLSFIPISRVASAQNFDLAASNPLILTDEQGEYPLGLYMEILEDPSGELTIEDISSPEYDAQFIPSQAQIPIYGFTDSAYWVRIHLKNETRNTDDWFIEVLFSNMQYIDLYTPLPDEDGFSIKQSGSLRPPSTRDLHYPRVVFNLDVPPQGEETIYLRFLSGTSMTLHLTLWLQSLFFNNAILEQIAFGIFFGILIGLLFYNLFILLSLRDASYFFIIFMLFNMILHEASYNGFLETYVIPDFYFLKRYYHPALFALMVASMILFADSFLELRERIPRLHQVTMVSVIGFGVLILLIPFVSFREIALFLLFWAFTSLLVLWSAGIFNYLRGKFRPARFFMHAWFGLVILFLGVLLVRLGVLPSTFFTENTYRLGILLVAIFWSISLADRVNVLKAETEVANQEVQRSEQRLAQILDGMPVGVVVYGQNHKPEYVNKRTSEILGGPDGFQPGTPETRTLEQVIEHYSMHVAGTEDKYPLEKLPVYSALNGMPASADDIEASVEDKVVPLEIWASPVRDSKGNVESAVAAFQDITRRKQAEAELIEQQEILESLVEKRTADLNTANKELRLHLEWLEAVNLINQMVARSTDFTQIHERIVEIIKHLFDVQEAFIAELDTNRRKLVILAHTSSDLYPELVGSFTSLPESIASTPEQGKLVLIPKLEMCSLDAPMGHHIQDSNLESIAVVPLQVREKVLGFLGLEMQEQGRAITKEEANLINIFATDIAQLIEDARLFEQAKLLVAVEERNRLARDLHDSVAQALYSISLFADATSMALKTDKQAVVESHLQELSNLSREALSDMRLLIFELRPPILEENGLVNALQSRLQSVEARVGYKTSVETTGMFHFSLAQENELYRIAQEALNNILKHAKAKQVCVNLSGDGNSFRLTIEDDGIGFDPSIAESKGGQGLNNMHERAARIGANCLIESAPGTGTKITIEVTE